MSSLALLIAQVATILVASRLIGLLFRRIHQPQVVGEMVAGILLGPSLLGWVAPTISAALFPPASLDMLSAMSQIGLVLFMFLVGIEVDGGTLRSMGKAATLISHVSIVAPFLLGSTLALYLYPRLSDDSVSFLSFALFMGASMSVTAFPVLARILIERGLFRSRVGTIAIGSAAVDDISAWCLLAVVVVVTRAGEPGMPLWLTVAGTAAFLAGMGVVVRPLLARTLKAAHVASGCVTHDALALVLVLMLVASLATEVLGIHPLFGAFVAGMIMPKDGKIDTEIAEKLEGVAVVLLLPLFFASTGLRTSIGLVTGLDTWIAAGLVVLVAVAGKFVGSLLAGRAAGLEWREASAIGVLMNTRGLIGLVILSVGYDLGILSPTLFAIMVLMALVTTFMTSPLLSLVYPSGRVGHAARNAVRAASADARGL